MISIAQALYAFWSTVARFKAHPACRRRRTADPTPPLETPSRTGEAGVDPVARDTAPRTSILAGPPQKCPGDPGAPEHSTAVRKGKALEPHVACPIVMALTPDGGHLTRENVHHGKHTPGVHS